MIGIAKLPIHRLKKAELVWLGSHSCKAHRVTYIAHYNCYLREHPEVQEKVGSLDIETSNFDANFGIMLSYCIKPLGSSEILYGVITQEDIKKLRSDQTDKRIVKKLIDDMLKFDRIVTHYGRKFDLKFARTRALMMNIPFPCFGSISNDDTWVIIKNKLKLNNNRLETADRALNEKSIKTHIVFRYWIAGIRGDQKALDYILDHNKKDVIALEKLWLKVRNFVSVRKCSI